MAKKTIVVTFSDLETAKNVVNNLTANQHAREDIGLAVNESTKQALVTVTLEDNNIDDTMGIFEQYNPTETDVRETGWRQNMDTRTLHPDEEQFTAIKWTDEK